MSFRASLIAVTALACLTLANAPGVEAADPQLKLPSFEHLQRVAVETVNVTIGRGPLSLAAHVLENSADPQDREFEEVLNRLQSVQVHSFKFASDGQFDAAEVDAIRNQLSAPGWNALAKIHQHGPAAENVDIYVSMDHELVNGLAILVAGPRELTVVNIVGSVDPATLAKFSTRLGLPSIAR